MPRGQAGFGIRGGVDETNGTAVTELGEGDLVAGRYRIAGFLGKGGMGAVYRAHDTHLDRVVALKVIKHEHAADPQYRDAFLREAKRAARIEHPNVVQVHDAGDDDGMLYLDMQYVEGENLAAHIQAKGRLPRKEALEYLRDIASALDAIHDYGLVHADVKPANILIAPDRAFLTDFGIARESRARPVIGSLTENGEWLESSSGSIYAGTPAYMAPEQWLEKSLDRRVDLYALGGILHTMLTGHPPYEGGDRSSLQRAHLHEPPPTPSSLVPELPAGIDQVVHKAMAKEPQDRYQSGEDLVVAATGRSPRRLARPFAVVGVGLLVLAGLIAWAWSRPPSETITTTGPVPTTVACGLDHQSSGSGETVMVIKNVSALVHDGPAINCPGTLRVKRAESLAAVCYVNNSAKNQWTYFDNGDGRRGWVWNEYLSPLSSRTPPCPTTATTVGPVPTTVPLTVACGVDPQPPSGSGETVMVIKETPAFVHNGPSGDCPGDLHVKTAESLVAVCFVINSAKNQWTYFDNGDGRRGWVWNDYLSPLSSRTPQCS